VDVASWAIAHSHIRQALVEAIDRLSDAAVGEMMPDIAMAYVVAAVEISGECDPRILDQCKREEGSRLKGTGHVRRACHYTNHICR
jgi:hypothetical protein